MARWELDVPDAYGRNERPKEGKGENNAKVPEKVLLLELVARVEDDRG
jgi:hypothetical protein